MGSRREGGWTRVSQFGSVWWFFSQSERQPEVERRTQGPGGPARGLQSLRCRQG